MQRNYALKIPVTRNGDVLEWDDMKSRPASTVPKEILELPFVQSFWAEQEDGVPDAQRPLRAHYTRIIGLFQAVRAFAASDITLRLIYKVGLRAECTLTSEYLFNYPPKVADMGADNHRSPFGCE